MGDDSGRRKPPAAAVCEEVVACEALLLVGEVPVGAAASVWSGITLRFPFMDSWWGVFSLEFH